MQEAYDFVTGSQTCIELCPEFFFGPEYFSEDFQLPGWCNDPYEFVYCHRKALEQPEISNVLHRWIDLIFGVATQGKAASAARNVFSSLLFMSSQEADESSTKRNGCMPLTLFTQPHPSRKSPIILTVSEESRCSLDHGNFEFVHIIETTNTSLTFLAVVHKSILLGKSDFVTVTHTIIGEFFCDCSLFTAYSGGLIAVDTVHSLIYHVKDRTIIRNSFPWIQQIASCSQTVIVADHNGQIFRMRRNEFPSADLVTSITHEYICALAVSHKFQTIAIGTFDGCIALSSLADGSLRRSFDAGEAPRRIVITDGWGFIIVDTGYTFSLFSINGRPIRHVKIGCSVTEIITWTCERGCDFVAIATENKQVHVFEAFYLRVDESIYNAPDKVMAMRYIVRSRALALVTASGDVILLPKELPE
jgi:hypothetical protein